MALNSSILTGGLAVYCATSLVFTGVDDVRLAYVESTRPRLGDSTVYSFVERVTGSPTGVFDGVSLAKLEPRNDMSGVGI